MKDVGKSKRSAVLLFLTALLILPGTRADDVCHETLRQRIESAHHPLLHQPNFSAYREDVARLYQAAPSALLWFDQGAPTLQAFMLANRFARADRKGLNPDDYEGGRWRDWLRPAGLAQTGSTACREWSLDLALTIATMRYVSDLRVGRINPRNLKIHLDVEPKRYDLTRFLLELAAAPQSNLLLDRIEPSFHAYRSLLDALQRYRELAEDPELSRPLTVPLHSLRPGETYPDLIHLEYRLRRWGDRDTTELAPIKDNVYSEALALAVRRFQGRHGLTQDGVIGRNTFAQLNVPMSERVEQIRMALERWRWLPDDLGYRPVVINVPEYKLYALEVDADGSYQQVLDMEVIVGESYPKHQTPLFRGAMRYIVFSPYWNVPYSILKRELYAKIEADPNYLAAHNYEIVSAFHPAAEVFPSDPENIAGLLTGELKLRQSPGPHNALGEAKFMFPNNHAVYLHGTPSKRLFRKDKRDFSHGCIRIADPPRMAAHVLSQEPGWDRERIDELIANGEWRQVGLSKPLQVYVLYGTAVADLDGTVRFFRDVYGHDDRLAQALRGDNGVPAI